jgi:DNA-binding NarL/FixJ family response regulator
MARVADTSIGRAMAALDEARRHPAWPFVYVPLKATDLEKVLESIPKRRTRPGKLDGRMAEITQRLAAGESMRAIARSLGVSHVSVLKRLRRVELDR